MEDFIYKGHTIKEFSSGKIVASGYIGGNRSTLAGMSVEEVKKKIDDEVAHGDASFQNGRLRAQNEINVKLMNAGIKIGNEHLDYSAYWRQVDSIRKEIKEEKDESKKRELEEKLKKFEKENSVRDYGV